MLTKLIFLVLSIVTCDLLGAAELHAAELRVADVFTDHAVLQRDCVVAVWGTANAGESVTVEFAGQTKEASVLQDGSWRVNLDPMRTQSTPSSLVVRSGQQSKELRDLLVGEVWYASGQSNMQMTLANCTRKIPQLAKFSDAPVNDQVRMIRIDEGDSAIPQVQLHKSPAWGLDSPENRPRQSAVAFFFANRLHRDLGVPIGIIEGSWGGKPIEGFISNDQFGKHDLLRSIESLASENKLDQLSALSGGVIIRNSPGMPGRIFNGRVSPIAPYALRGFVWYQGESNAGRGEDPRDYRVKMQALIDGWRETWSDDTLPFYFVQLPAFNNSANGWVRLREEQRLSLAIQYTGMAVTIDLRDTDIHPANKLDVGNRLARWALAKTYGQDIPCSGPLFKSAKVQGGSIRVHFDHAESGLMIARKDGIGEPIPTSDAELSHFEIADATGNWYPAQAVIESTTIIVKSTEVGAPRAVRYACSGGPENANLYSKAKLPASPFCSDLKLLPWTNTP